MALNPSGGLNTEDESVPLVPQFMDERDPIWRNTYSPYVFKLVSGIFVHMLYVDPFSSFTKYF